MEASQPLIRSCEHDFELHLPQEEVFVHVDPVRLAQVLGNLLTNAAKYSPPRGWIGLEAKGQPDGVCISVSDRGFGIPADALQRIFEPFAQLQPHQAAAAGGLGIGLSVVKQLVELHGGTVTAQSGGPGTGSSFTITLPRAPAPPVPLVPIATRARPEAPPSRRVLVVDDNVDAAETMAALLEIDGHTVAIAHNGAEAIRVAGEFRPDVAFLDIGMPDISGYDVAAAIRQLPQQAQVCLVALTGWGAERDRERSRDAGFHHHLVKPATVDAILGVMRQAAAEAPGKPH